MAAKDRTEAFIEEKTQNGNPREKEALEYIKKHKVMELFDNFTAQLLYSRPYLIREIFMLNDGIYEVGTAKAKVLLKARQNLTEAYADPRAFLMERLQKLIKSRAVSLDPPSHFDKSNIDSVFGMMDPTKKGVITFDQYKAGMTTLGVKEYDPAPTGCDTDKISHDTFGREARKGVAQEAMTYYEKPNPRSM